MIDYKKVKSWPFADEKRHYQRADMIRYARGFGAGLSGPLRDGDRKFVGEDDLQALPMTAAALADGEFWQQRSETGIDWRRIVHAAETITQHRPLPPAGEYLLKQRVVDIFDRGAERGASMVQQQIITDSVGGPLVTIEVTTILKGDGGFGGEPDPTRKVLLIPDDQLADIVLEIKTPVVSASVFSVTVALDVAQDAAPGQNMIRGVGCFGLAGRAAVHALCDNHPERLRKFGVRYSGPMFTGETMRVEIWRLGAHRATLRMTSVERNALVLDQCLIEFD